MVSEENQRIQKTLKFPLDQIHSPNYAHTHASNHLVEQNTLEYRDENEIYPDSNSESFTKQVCDPGKLFKLSESLLPWL